MSIAHPEAILREGVLDPRLIPAMVAVVSQHGGDPRRMWRITSGWRPTGTHATGRAFDAAPLKHITGGIGLNTARAIHPIVKAAVPTANWLVNAEADHVHIMLYEFDSIGINLNSGTHIIPL